MRIERRVESWGEERIVEGEACCISFAAFRHDLNGSM